MLFNSYIFVFLFLPICLLGYYTLINRRLLEPALTWLVLCSLFFYGWWNPVYISLLVASMLSNFLLGRLISRQQEWRKPLLVFGIAGNLGVLGYFKYCDFFIGTFNSLSGSDFNLLHIVLPLGISFITFQKIAFLVDAYKGKTHEYNLLHFCLFVTFFPQLLAGPIVHHRELIPQFVRLENLQKVSSNLGIGLSIFLVGLFKKTVLADGAAVHANPVFDAAANGATLTLLEAWGGSLAYSLQLYFDFSGYSDMAIGLARMFGVVLPLNFFSPYRARNISEFWRRWHITLSRFLRDYLYIPLGGNRSGEARRLLNLMITMLLGGLWHGAAWTFVVWGGLHGAYLVIHRSWERLTAPLQRFAAWRIGFTPLAYLLTFLSVMVAWVFFRATSFDAAWAVLQGMAGFNGISLHPDSAGLAEKLRSLGLSVDVSLYATRLVGKDTLNWVVTLLLIATCLPNTAQVFSRIGPALDEYSRPERYQGRLRWNPTRRWAMTIASLGLMGVLYMSQVSEFIYFQF